MSEAAETIALLGSTGNTGKEFLPLALKGGYKVRALVRDPKKISLEDNNLSLIQGDFEDEEALTNVLHGSDYIVCMAAAKKVDGIYPQDFMLNFVKRLYAIIDKLDNHRPKVFLYQAGSMSADATGFLHPVAWSMKQTLGRKFDIFDKIQDNNNVIKYLGQQAEETGIKYVVTRAGILREGTKEKDARLSQWVR